MIARYDRGRRVIDAHTDTHKPSREMCDTHQQRIYIVPLFSIAATPFCLAAIAIEMMDVTQM